jgi:hypothetical protein
VSRFAEVRAEVEETVRQNFGEVQWANIDIMASSMMAKYYGMLIRRSVPREIDPNRMYVHLNTMRTGQLQWVDPVTFRLRRSFWGGSARSSSLRS